MEKTKVEKIYEGMIIFFCIILLTSMFFEACLIGVAFIYADEVECTYFWCTFKITKTDANVFVNQSCFQDGEPINCDDIDTNGFFNNTFGDFAWS